METDRQKERKKERKEERKEERKSNRPRRTSTSWILLMLPPHSRMPMRLICGSSLRETTESHNMAWEMNGQEIIDP